MLGVAQVIRNRVESGYNGGDWLQVLNDVPVHSAEEIVAMDWRSLPEVYDKDFRWLYSQVSLIYDRTLPDEITTSANVNWAAHQSQGPRSMPRKGLYYCNLQLPIRPWFKEKIIDSDQHSRQAEAGCITFFS